MKIANLASLDPLHTQQGKKGLSRRAKMDDEIWAEFSGKPNDLRKLAQAILDCGTLPEVSRPSDEEDIEEAYEGKVLTRVHRARERDSRLAKKKKEKVLAKHGKIECEACGFVFVEKYGGRGEGFIECHHTLPLTEYVGKQKTKIEDLALLCANCHRMVHAKKPWLTLQELKSLIAHPNQSPNS